jgi:ABC-type glycerol-3-phosphate transport system permease component
MSSRSSGRVGRGTPRLSTILIYAQTILLLAITLFPVLWLIQLSLKVENEAFRMPPKLWFVPTFENYLALLQGKFARSFGKDRKSVV